MLQLFVLAVVIIMLGSALAIFFLRDLIAALIAFSVLSLCLSVLFVVLKAPDVAMTEAAVGAGLGSLLFALAISRIMAGITDE